MARLITTFAVLGLFAAALPAQESLDRLAARVELGEKLFSDTRLSRTEEVSCATCHDPKNLFADGKQTSVGVLGVEVGRNAPSLLATARIHRFPALDKHDKFPRVPLREPQGSGPRRVIRGRFASAQPAIIAVTLEDRCLGPIENPFEMGNSVEAVLEVLRKDRHLAATFDAAFGDVGGITANRLGKVLADFLRSLEPQLTPYARYLTGDATALDATQKAGLEVFEGVGRCADCHNGPALSDGRVHTVTLPQSDRARARRQADRARLLRTMRHRKAAPRGSKSEQPAARDELLVSARGHRGYDGGSPGRGIQALTPPLWELTRTAPYFRDGSERDLRAAIRRHISELRAVRTAENKRVAVTLEARQELPPSLRPAWDRPPPPPGRLKPRELDALMSFLGALSSAD